MYTVADYHTLTSGRTWDQPKVSPSSVAALSKLHNADIYVGVEIELEMVPSTLASVVEADPLGKLTDLINMYPKGSSLPMELAVFFKQWDVVQDHSLRGEMAKEFLFKQPYKGDALRLALYSIGHVFDSAGKTSLYSPRCGTHVHINTMDMSMKEYAIHLMLYLFMEPTLLSYCGAGRKSSIYCVPATDSSDILETVASFFHCVSTCAPLPNNEQALVQGYKALIDSWPKYCAVNIGNDKGAKGTFEYRSLETTTNTDALMEWINILLDIRSYANKLYLEGMSLEQIAECIIQDPELVLCEITSLLDSHIHQQNLVKGASAVVGAVYGSKTITNLSV